MSRIAFHIAAEFGEKRFLVKLKALIRDRPFDIVNLELEVPALKGALEKTPSHTTFEDTSTEQQDISEFLNGVRTLVRENQLVLVNENRVWTPTMNTQKMTFHVGATRVDAHGSQARCMNAEIARQSLARFQPRQESKPGAKTEPEAIPESRLGAQTEVKSKPKATHEENS